MVDRKASQNGQSCAVILVVDCLHEQKSTSGSIPVNQAQESEATVGIDSPALPGLMYKDCNISTRKRGFMLLLELKNSFLLSVTKASYYLRFNQHNQT